MNYILGQLAEKKIIAKEEYANYKYAFNVLLLKFVHCFAILITAFFLNIVSETVLFLYCYSMIRTYVGGIHANNPIKCFILSILFVIGLRSIINIHLNYILIIIFSIVISYYWYINCMKQLSNIKFLIHLMFINIILWILVVFDQLVYVNCILYGFILNIVLFNMRNILLKHNHKIEKL